MSRLAADLGAVNLGQGFPDYPIDPRLAELVHQAMLEGHNQYAPMIGVPLLREQISLKIARYYGVAPNPESEVTITLGATEAIFSAIQALVGAGDEVIVFDPSYDSYEPAIQLAGARCLHARMLPPLFRPDWDEVRSLLIRPHPAGDHQFAAESRLHLPVSAADLQTLAELLRGRDCRVLSDEVYEHVVFDGQAHQSVLAHAELRERSVAVYSFGKTLHATGMRIGYAVAPADTEHRTSQGASVQHLQHPDQPAAGDRAISSGAAGLRRGPAGILPGQARSAGRICLSGSALRGDTRGGHLLSADGLQRGCR